MERKQMFSHLIIKLDQVQIKTLSILKSVTYMPSCSSEDDAMKCKVQNNITLKISENIMSAGYRHGEKK